MRRWLPAVAALAVVASYFSFASRGTFAFRWIAPERATERSDQLPTYYPALAEGFLHGRLDMPFPADARWKNVANAYDAKVRAPHGLEWEMWDATYYRGRFYLYFSPLPVLLFYIPLRLVTGAYPPDALVAALAAAWAFLMCVAFARRVLRDRKLLVPFEVWVLLIGVANVVPFTLTHVRAYEVAVATGMAMTASWAYAMLRWTESGATRHAVWMSVWLGLAIATRPNLIVLIAITAVVMKTRRAIFAAVLALTLIGGAVAAYNYARFGDIFELGMTYQISYEPMWRHAPCSLCDVPDALRFVSNVMHYTFWAPGIRSTFPYVELQRNVMDPAASFHSGAEPIGGVFAVNPLVLIGTMFALYFARMRNATTLVMAAAWLILFTLATCRWVTARYSLDFMLLMIAASAVSIEHGLAALERAGVRVWVLRALVVALALYAIAMGALLGQVL